MVHMVHLGKASHLTLPLKGALRGPRFGVNSRRMKTKKKKAKKKTGGGRMARRKGHSFEREIAIKFRKIFPEARRHLEYQDSEALGRDLANVGDYLVQCKRGRRYASFTAIEEIQICPIDGGVPILVTKGDDKPILAALPLEHLLKLISFYQNPYRHSDRDFKRKKKA